jgi:hypothetical protein
LSHRKFSSLEKFPHFFLPFLFFPFLLSSFFFLSLSCLLLPLRHYTIQQLSRTAVQDQVPPHAASPMAPPSPLPSRQQSSLPFPTPPPPPLPLRRAPHGRQSSSQVRQWPPPMQGLNQARFFFEGGSKRMHTTFLLLFLDSILSETNSNHQISWDFILFSN